MDHHPGTPDSTLDRTNLAALQAHRDRLLTELAIVDIDIRHLLTENVTYVPAYDITENIRQQAITRARRVVDAQKEKVLMRVAHGDRELAGIYKNLFGS